MGVKCNPRVLSLTVRWNSLVDFMPDGCYNHSRMKTEYSARGAIWLRDIYQPSQLDPVCTGVRKR